MAIEVVYVDSVRDFGGAQAHLLSALKYLDRERFHVRVLCHPDNPITRQLEDRGIEWFPNVLRSKFDVKGCRRLRADLRRLKPDIVHFEDNLSHWLGAWAAGWARVPVRVATVHMVNIHRSEVPFPWWKRHLWIWADRIWMSRVDRIITVAEFNRQAMIREEGQAPEKVVTAHASVDLAEVDAVPVDREEARRELGVAADVPVVGMTTRLSSQKGIDIFLRAAVEVRRRIPAARFVIVGTGPLEAEMKDLAAELSLADAVIFTGFRPDIFRLIDAFDVMVLSSYFEGLPRQVLDAMSRRKPVVATDVSGTPEAVLDEETGRLVPAGDVPALAGAIAEVLTDPEKGRRWGSAGRQLVERMFSMEGFAGTVTRVYEEELARIGLESRGGQSGHIVVPGASAPRRQGRP